jgi:hypothetical protein
MYIVSAFPELRCPDASALRAVLAAAGSDLSRVESRSPDPSSPTPAAEPVAYTGGECDVGSARAGAHEPSPVAASAAPRPMTIMELGAGNGSNLFAIRRHNPTARIYASDFSRAALKYISSAVARAESAASGGGESARRATLTPAAGAKPGEAAMEAGGSAEADVVSSATAGGATSAGGCAPRLQANAFRLFLWDVVAAAPPRPPSPASAAGGSGTPRRRSLQTCRGASPTAAAAAAFSATEGDSSAAAPPHAAAVPSDGTAAGSRHSGSADSATRLHAASPVSSRGRHDAAIAHDAAPPAGPPAGSAAAPPASSAAARALPGAPAASGALDAAVGEADWAEPPPVVRGGCDIALLTFVLSAIPPEGHLRALRNVRQVSRRGDAAGAEGGRWGCKGGESRRRLRA